MNIGEPVQTETRHSTLLIDRVINEHVAPFLKGEGFRRGRGNFWRDTGCVVDVVTIQKARWNGPLESSFTIDLGLYWKDIQRRLDYLSGLTEPKAWDCLVNERIGPLLCGRDFWWDLTPSADVQTIGFDVVGKLSAIALPWLVAGHALTVAFSYASAYGETIHSDAFKAVIEGRPVMPCSPPVRKGFGVVDGREYDTRTREGRKTFKQALRNDMKRKPNLVRFQGDGLTYDLNTKEGKKALKDFVEKTKNRTMTA